MASSNSPTHFPSPLTTLLLGRSTCSCSRAISKYRFSHVRNVPGTQQMSFAGCSPAEFKPRRAGTSCCCSFVERPRTTVVRQHVPHIAAQTAVRKLLSLATLRPCNILLSNKCRLNYVCVCVCVCRIVLFAGTL